MDEVFYRSGIIDFERLKELGAKSDFRAWVQLLSHFGAIGLTGTAIYFTLGSWWVIPPILLHGTLINYLMAAEHEMGHNTAFRTPQLNEYWGRVIGFIIVKPRDADQLAHFSHHRYTQLWGQDGELYTEPYTFLSYLLNLSGVKVFPQRFVGLAKSAIGPVMAPYASAKGRKRMEREARWHLLGYLIILAVSITLWTPVALIYWLVPMMLTKIFHIMHNSVEHTGMPYVADISENTRTIRTNAFMRWMCWQMQYHTAHHAFPGVPFHALKQLHREVFTARGSEPTTMTYLGFQWAILKALWQKGEAEHDRSRQWVPAPATPQSAVASDVNA